MSDDQEMLQRWQALSQQANVVFAGQPTEDVGGALAMLTAMLVAGLMQGEEFDRHNAKAVAMAIVAQHGTLIMNLVPSFLEAIDEAGGWDKFNTKGSH